MAFRGFQLKPGKKVDIGEKDENGLIHLSNSCLADGDKAQLFCTVNGMRLIVAVLEKDVIEHQKLNLRFDTSADKCTLESVGGEIHVTGFFEDLEDMMPGMEDDLDNLSEEDIQTLLNAGKNAETKAEDVKPAKKAEQAKAEESRKAEAKAAELKAAEAKKKAEEQKAGEAKKKAEEQKKADLAKKAAEKKKTEEKPQEKKVESNADFIASKKFAGAKAGYVFKKDKKGLGYYKDTYVAPKGLKRKAEDTETKGGKKILQLMGGVKAEVTRNGAAGAAKATKGKQVTVKYDGRLTNGKRFDRGSIRFRLGGGEVIKGWDVGVEGMLVGEKRKLLIPPKFAYGARGAPPDIPPNATLAFDVELVRL